MVEHLLVNEARTEDDKKLKKSLDEMAKDLENVTYRA